MTMYVSYSSKSLTPLVRQFKDYFLENFGYLDGKLDELAKQCEEKLVAQGFSRSQICSEPFLHLRYSGTDCALMCGPSSSASNSLTPKYGDFKQTFLHR